MATAPESQSPDGKTGGFQASKDCDLCGSTTPVKFCQECEFTLCPICATGHQKIKATKDHPLVDIDILSSALYAKSGDSESGPSSCVKHPKNAVEFFCEECIVMFCTDCRQDHKHHTVQPLDLKTYQNICTQHMKILLDKTHDLEGHKTLISGIFTNYEEAIKMVKKWEEELVKLVQESSRSLSEYLEKAKKEWENVVNADGKGLTKITTDVENKLSELHSIRKVTDVDIFSSELAASQQLLEKVNNFIQNILPTLKVPDLDDLLPNMSELSNVTTAIADFMSPIKKTKPEKSAQTSLDLTLSKAEKSVQTSRNLTLSRIGETYSLPNLLSLAEISKICVEDPDSHNGYMINKSHINDNILMIHGSWKKDIHIISLAQRRYTSEYSALRMMSIGFDHYIAIGWGNLHLLNSKFENVYTKTSDNEYRGLAYLSCHTFLLLEVEDNNKTAHLSFVNIKNDRFIVTREKTLNFKEKACNLLTDENKTHAFICGDKHLYKVKLEDWTTNHIHMSKYMKYIWSLCVVGDNILVGDDKGRVHMLDTQLNYKKVILKMSEAVRDMAVINGYLVVTSKDNKVYLYT